MLSQLIHDFIEVSDKWLFIFSCYQEIFEFKYQLFVVLLLINIYFFLNFKSHGLNIYYKIITSIILVWIDWNNTKHWKAGLMPVTKHWFFCLQFFSLKSIE
jgi:hypothetical protein